VSRTKKLFSLFRNPRKYLPDWWTDELTRSADTNGATWAELCMRISRGIKKDIWRTYNDGNERARSPRRKP
jgi:hypothetical protein